MRDKSKKIKIIFLVYWFLLLYVVSALIWWYIALSRQNNDIFKHRLNELNPLTSNYQQQQKQLVIRRDAKTAQYMGEGVIFFLLIGAGAIFLYRAVKKQLQLSEQQKNFMMAVTHELKTPIAVTKLNLETLQKRKLDEEQYQKLLQNALDETNRMNALCSNLLVSSQMESGKYTVSSELVFLRDFIKELIRDFTNRFPERKIIIHQSEDMTMQTDVFLLQILIHNLLHNAHKYSPKDQPVEIEVIRNDRKLTIAVVDHGNGIPLTERSRIFEKYYRVGASGEQQVKGTGLGLYIAKRITELLDARIDVEDDKTKGSVFKIQFNMKDVG